MPDVSYCVIFASESEKFDPALSWSTAIRLHDIRPLHKEGAYVHAVCLIFRGSAFATSHMTVNCTGVMTMHCMARSLTSSGQYGEEYMMDIHRVLSRRLRTNSRISTATSIRGALCFLWKARE